MRARDRFRQWWAQYWAWDARLRWQDRRPAHYSLIAVRRATTAAKWLVGLNGAALVLSFSFYIQAYMSILSIKGDCPSLLFVADAIKGALIFASWFLVAGTLAAIAAGWPSAIGIGRNMLGWRKGRPPLEPEHEFEGWSEFQVANRVAGQQWILVVVSSVFFFAAVVGVLILRVGSNPGEEWHSFELQCLPKPSDQGSRGVG